MKAQSAKAKGRKLQQWVRDLILSNHRSLEEDDVRSTSMGAGGEDVLLSPAARALVPVSIECKSRAHWAFYKDIDQCVANAPKNTEPILVLKGNKRAPVVVVDAEYFFANFRKGTRR